MRAKVTGSPHPKGSLMCRGPRTCRSCQAVVVHPVTEDDTPDSKVWRERLTLAGRKLRLRQGFGFEGPVAIDATFVMPRPKAATKREFPHVRPDLDKLSRMLLDALQDSKLIDDDSLVVDLTVRKRYPAPDLLDEPGVIFTVTLADTDTAPSLTGL